LILVEFFARTVRTLKPHPADVFGSLFRSLLTWQAQ
jgi:hypothetical protein